MTARSSDAHPLLTRLDSPNPDERRTACQEAPQDPSAALLTDALSAALGDPSKAVARAASDALVAIGRQVGGIEDALRRALHSDEPERRWGAAFTTARVEPPSPKLLPALVEAMGCPDGDVRWAAARLLVETGRLHDEVLPLLLGLVRRGENPVLRRMASFSLRELAPDHPEAARVLLEATGDEDLHVRRAALTASAGLMDPPPPFTERLLAMLAGDPDAASRRLAALAIGELVADRSRDELDVAEEALRRSIGPEADPDLRRAVERALRRMGREPSA